MSRFESGWIKFHRRAVEGDIGSSGIQLAVWTTLLCWATRFESSVRWEGQQRVIPPGTVVTGNRELAGRLKFSKSSVYRAIAALRARDSIRTESGTRGTLITICNWSTYQNLEAEVETSTGQQSNASETSAGRLRTLNGEVKKKRINLVQPYDLESAYQKYPRKEGKTPGMKRLAREIRSQKDFDDLNKAVENYARAKEGKDKDYIKLFSTFVAEWRDWVDSRPESPTINTVPLKLEEIR